MNNNFIKRNVCPICNSYNNKIICNYPLTSKKIWSFIEKYYQGRVPKKKMNSNFCVVKCNTCTLLFQQNILNDSNMFLLYEKWISAEESLNKKRLAGISLFNKYAFEIGLISKIVNKKPNEINVLEFGMGWGFWSNVAKAFNFKITGTELSETRIKYAEKNGIRIINNISSEKEESYDYIYTNQVFEHISNPNETIKKLSKILKKNGIIHIGVPNGHGIEKKLKDKNWSIKKRAIYPLEHINCFNRKSFKHLAKQANLVIMPSNIYLKTSTTKSLFKSLLLYIYNYNYPTQVFLKKNN